MAKDRTTTVLAIVAVILCVALGYLSRLALNPDGVSYLDLAAAVPKHDWSHFVQGYWSPLFPLIVGEISQVTGLVGANLVPVTHVINTIAAVAGVWIIWRWSRAVAATRPLFGRLAIAAFLLCSFWLPKLEVVTPDVISLLVAVWISHELLRHGSQRWLLTGVLFGVSFLVKTSTWPLLIVAVPLRLWAAPDTPARRRVWWSTAVCALLMLGWIVPMSVKAGHPTLGSSGRLNFSWYINASRNSQSPDADRGNHAGYQQVPIGDGQQITVATFDEAATWTYQPWGDPTAWAEGITSKVEFAPTVGELTSYWLRMSMYVFVLWLGPMLLTAIVPAFLLYRRPGVWRELVTTQRHALVVGGLGIVGLFQFIAIHVEPRLIAPYAIMLALGSIWLDTAAPATRPLRPIVRNTLAWVGAIAALGLAGYTLVTGAASTARLIETTHRLDAVRQRLATVVQGPFPIAIIGPAMPVLSAAYWSGVHVTMQIPPSSAKLLGTLPPDQQAAILGSLFVGRVPLVWKTTADGGVEMLIVPDDSTHKNQP
jgi:hypothetical protein